MTSAANPHGIGKPDASSNRVCKHCGIREGDHLRLASGVWCRPGSGLQKFEAAEGVGAIPNSAMTDDYKKARGARPRQPGEPRAEDRIRAGRATPNSVRCPCGDPLCVLINAIKDYTDWPDQRAIDAAYGIKEAM